MPRNSTSQGPQTTSNLTQIDKRVGIEGTGNVVLGDGSAFSFTSKDTNTSQNIKGDGNFAPVFNFTGTGISRIQSLTAPVAAAPRAVRKF